MTQTFQTASKNSSPPLLLHCCCGPCASACVERLLAEKRKIVLFYSNSNILSQEEFDKRSECVRFLSEKFSLPLIIDPYDHEAWLAHVKQLQGYEKEKERGSRCAYCFEYSLGRTALYAAEKGYAFATTLTVSPHKNSRLIFSIGEKYPHFECWDFKKQDGFKRSILLSKEYGFYRQDFCGCEFSFRSKEDAPSIPEAKGE